MDSGDRLAYAVRVAGVTQAELERKADYSSGYVGKIIRGDQALSSAAAQKLAPLLDTTPQWLLFGTGIAPKPPSEIAESDGAYQAPRMVCQVEWIRLPVCGECRSDLREGARICPHCNAHLIWPD